MKLFDFFKKKRQEPGEEPIPSSTENAVDVPAESSPLTPEAIVKTAMEKEPLSIYGENGKTLAPEILQAVTTLIPGYNGERNLTNNLVENDPKQTKENLQSADTDTLLLFFKFLTVKAREGENNPIVGIMQACTLAILRGKLG